MFFFAAFEHKNRGFWRRNVSLWLGYCFQFFVVVSVAGEWMNEWMMLETLWWNPKLKTNWNRSVWTLIVISCSCWMNYMQTATTTTKKYIFAEIESKNSHSKRPYKYIITISRNNIFLLLLRLEIHSQRVNIKWTMLYWCGVHGCWICTLNIDDWCFLISWRCRTNVHQFNNAIKLTLARLNAICFRSIVIEARRAELRVWAWNQKQNDYHLLFFSSSSFESRWSLQTSWLHHTIPKLMSGIERSLAITSVTICCCHRLHVNAFAIIPFYLWNFQCERAALHNQWNPTRKWM